MTLNLCLAFLQECRGKGRETLKLIENRSIYKIKSLFPIREKQQLFVILDELKWNSERFTNLVIHIGDEKINMNYIGCGNVEGSPMLVLTLNDSRYGLVEDISNLTFNNMTLERLSEL